MEVIIAIIIGISIMYVIDRICDCVENCKKKKEK